MGCVLALTLLLAAHAATAATLVNSWTATGVAGALSPPNYGLRLDGFFDNNVNHEVTFAFDNVTFNEFDDGSARLFGTISIAEYDNSGGPGAFASTWDLDVAFQQTTGSNASWRYYNLISNGRELENTGNSNDYANFFQFMGPFQVGNGANGKNANFGAAGWVNYVHFLAGGGTTGSESTHYYSSDFLMDLTRKDIPVIPEPATLSLIGLGLGSLAAGRRFRRSAARS